MHKLTLLLALPLLLRPAQAQELSAQDRARIDAAVQQVLQDTGVPSVSVGMARGGHVVYAHAYGSARLPRNVGMNTGTGDAVNLAAVTEKAVAADAAYAYPIGSISKQFTAACILLLQERGKLTLEDPVGRWFPELTRSKEVTVRNLLTHTSGYSDYAPQDYTIPAWTRPRLAIDIVHEWAEKPLDFDPGTQWQYSNTNFEIAALIVEQASGQRFHDFLWANVITPLKLEGVLDLDVGRDRLQVRGYEQHALGPMRAAILEAPGWYYGDAQLAMPVATLLAWDMSLVHKTLLRPESYAAMTTEFKLKDGKGTHYGLGVFVDTRNGHRVMYHSGEVGGYVANNVVFPEDGLAIAVLTNQEASSAAGSLTTAVSSLAAPYAAPAKPKRTGSSEAGTPTAAGLGPNPVTPKVSMPGQASPAKASGRPDAPAALVQTILTGLAEGDIDRTRLTVDANFYFNDETLEDFASSLAPLGNLQAIREENQAERGGMLFRSYRLVYASRTLRLTTYTLADGRLEQFLVGPAE